MTKRLDAEIVGQLHTLDATAPWDGILSLLADRLHAESAACYSIGASVELAYWVGPYGDSFFRAIRAAQREGVTDTFAYDPREPAPELRNRALTLKQVVQANRGRRGEFIERMRERDYAKNDQLAVLLCDENRFLACVGVARPERFGAREQRALGRLIPALQERLKLEVYRNNGPIFRAGLNASLDLIPGEACLVAATASSLHIVEANQRARDALHRDRAGFFEELRESLFAPAFTAAFRVSRLESAGVSNHFLLVRLPAQAAPDTTRLEAARLRWGLTEKQGAVLSLLVRGHANKAIATELACAERTIEHHVTALLQRSSAFSRAELIRGSGRCFLSQPQSASGPNTPLKELLKRLARKTQKWRFPAISPGAAVRLGSASYRG